MELHDNQRAFRSSPLLRVRKKVTTRLIGAFFFFAFEQAWPSQFCSTISADGLPEIELKEQSDWLNVKTDVFPKAIGDGVNDDAAAIQAALNMVGRTPGTPKVVYLPPGTYRLTKTLGLRDRSGFMLIGHGKNSVLTWGGGLDERMFRSNGVPRSSFSGVVLDGRGVAAVGLDHDSDTVFETHVLHRDMEFRNFTTAGIRAGHRNIVASAEMMFLNVRFRNNRNGALFQGFNNYNNIFDGVEFQDNGTAIRAERGNVVVSNARFERSRIADLYLGAHSHAIRQCVSIGSRQFIITESTNNPLPIVVQGCRVERWGEKAGALVSGGAGPVTLIDNIFSDPPDGSQPVNLDNLHGVTQPVLLSGNEVVREMKGAIAEQSIVRGRFESNSLESVGPSRVTTGLEEHFLKDSAPLPAKFFDLKVDCSAAGDGTVDDTAALQRCVSAARQKTGSTVYVPSGRYRISGRIDIDQSISIAGAGWHSILEYYPATGGPLLRILGGEQVRIENLSLGGGQNVTRLLFQPRSGSSLLLSNVYGYHDDQAKTNAFEFRDPDGIGLADIRFLSGTLIFRNFKGEAIVRGAMSTSLTVENSGSISRPIAVLNRVSCCAQFPLTVTGNSYIAIRDWYNEQTAALVRIDGRDGDTSGRVSLNLTQADTYEIIGNYFNSYDGVFSVTGGMFGRYEDNRPRAFYAPSYATSTRPLVAAAVFKNVAPSFIRISPDLISSTLWQKGVGGRLLSKPITKSSEASVGTAMADFRFLSRNDLSAQYCDK